MVSQNARQERQQLVEAQARWMRLRDLLKARVAAEKRAQQIGVTIETFATLDSLRSEVATAQRDYEQQLSSFQD